MLHVDGKKGAWQGPTGSEAGDRPSLFPSPETAGKLTPQQPDGSPAAVGGVCPSQQTACLSRSGGRRCHWRKGHSHGTRKGRAMGGLGGLTIFSHTRWPPGTESILSFHHIPGSTPNQSQARASGQLGAASGRPLPKQKGADGVRQPRTRTCRDSGPRGHSPSTGRRKGGRFCHVLPEGTNRTHPSPCPPMRCGWAPYNSGVGGTR